MADEQILGPLGRADKEALERTRLVSVDWSKQPEKRAVHVSCMSRRSIKREQAPSSGWNLEALLNLAEGLACDTPVLVGIDVVLGVPGDYWQLLAETHDRQFEHFIDWLREIDPGDSFFETTHDADDWNPARPWFAVQKGVGGLKRFTDQVPGGMLRQTDKAAKAKPLFAVSGIPGTVGSGTRQFWKELAPRLATGRRFAVWPFEGNLSHCPIVLAESYPRLAYGAALAGTLPIGIIGFAKNNPEYRKLAIDCLARTEWVATHEVDLVPAREEADNFDAFFTTAALLRCRLEGRPLVDSKWICGSVEGSMLLAGPVDLDR